MLFPETTQVVQPLEIPAMSLSRKEAYEEFVTTHEALTVKNLVVEFNPEWKNGTDYFDGCVVLCNADTVGMGHFASFCPDSRRRLVIHVSEVGTLVVFERYTDGQNEILVSNRSNRNIRHVIHDGALSPDHIVSFLNGSYVQAVAAL